MVPNWFLVHSQPFFVYLGAKQRFYFTGCRSVCDQTARIWVLRFLASWQLTSHALYYNLPYLNQTLVNIFCSWSLYYFADCYPDCCFHHIILLLLFLFIHPTFYFVPLLKNGMLGCLVKGLVTKVGNSLSSGTRICTLRLYYKTWSF